MNSFRAAYFMTIGLMTTAIAIPAHAGFQWTPGQNQAASASAPSTPSLVSPSGEYTGPADGSAYMPDPVTAEPLASPPQPIATQTTPAPVAEDEILMPMPVENSAPAPAMQTQNVASDPIHTSVPALSETAGTQPQRNAANQNSGPTFQWMGQGETPQQRGWNSGTVDQKFQPAPAIQAAPTAAPAMQQNETFSVVQGFGSDLPLVLALPQIVPPEYSYSFGSGVNPGAMVTWNGGKAWNLVLQDMVAPLGLQAEITGKTVRFEKALQYSPAKQAAAPQENSYVESMQRRNITDPGQGNLIPSATEAYKAPMQDNIHVSMSASDEPTMIAPQPANNYVVSQPAPAADTEEDISWVESISQKMAKFGDELRSGNKVEPTETRMWEAAKGDSLKDTLVAWSKDANVNLVWNSSKDYTVNSNIMVNGTFNNAVKTVFTEGLTGEQKPNLKFVDNPNSSQSTTFIVSDAG